MQLPHGNANTAAGPRSISSEKHVLATAVFAAHEAWCVDGQRASLRRVQQRQVNPPVLGSLAMLNALRRLVKENAEVDLEIEPGMVQGQELKFHGEGEAHADGKRRYFNGRGGGRM